MDTEDNDNTVELQGRKRKGDVTQWKQNVRKRLRTQGLQYTNAKGNVVPAKTLGPDCNCKKKCMEKMLYEEKLDAFKRINMMESKNVQDTFLQGLIEAKQVVRRRKRVKDSSKQNQAMFSYHAMIGDSRVQVCFKAFLSLHVISVKRVRRLQNFVLTSKTPVDLRGKTPKRFALPPETLLLIRRHIESFPTHTSHYSGTVIQYLDERLDVKKLYMMFKTKHPQVKVGYTYFYKYFKEQYNLKFGQPQVDCCSTCEALNVKLKTPHLGDAAKRVASAELMVHLRRAKRFYNKLKSESSNKEDAKVLAICFDYMQNLTVPVIPMQETFYLSQINVNVFSIHNIKKNTAKVYLYHEGEAKKGPNEVCSFLADYLNTDVPASYEELHIYSDNCAGQNKNHALSRYLCALAERGRFKKIDQYYPVRGHSFLPCDRDFSQIKRSLARLDRLYTIKQIIMRIIHSGSNIHKFTVKKVETSDIQDYKHWWPSWYTKTPLSQESRGKRAPNAQKVRFGIQSFSHFSYNSEYPGYVFAYTTIDGLQKHTFHLRNKAARGEPPPLPSEGAYPAGKLPIKQRKIDDVKKLSQYIPEKYRQFFNHLCSWPTVAENANNDEND